MTMPTISVVCPTYNSKAFVSRAIKSIIEQTIPPYELIICDDGSSDGTERVAENLLIRSGINYLILKGPHRGPGATRNTGIRTASGEWIAFIDSDDFWEPLKLEKISETISKNIDINFICHHEIMVRRNGEFQKLEHGKRYVSSGSLVRQVYASNIFSTSAVVCRKDLLLESGLFDENLMSGQDYELWIRLSPHMRPFFIRQFLGCYVERDGNITSGPALRRIVNELKIAVRHKNMVPLIDFFWRISRILRSYSYQLIVGSLARSLRYRLICK
jgi:glycosyltransferase involved in cell wall biosynthesis